MFGLEQLLPLRRLPALRNDPVAAFSRWDGEWYARIATEGYSYAPDKRSSVAFFPLYPLLGKGVTIATGLRVEIALLIVAHLLLFGCFVLMHAYVSSRPHPSPLLATASLRPEGEGNLAAHTVIAFAFWPTTFFFRMAYSESVFVFLCVLALYGMHRNWRSSIIAIVAGLATAARPVGIALLLPFAWHLWTTQLQHRLTLRSTVMASLLCLTACWGLIAYMVYQQIAFGDALGFAKTQESWRMREGSVEEKVLALVTLEPVWSVYVPSSDAYWAKRVKSIDPLFNLQAANPVYFLIGAGLVAYGAWRRWLNAYEVLLSIGLILIPYETRSYEMCMASQGRFMAAVFPMYIVMGELLRRIPSPWFVLLVAPSAFFLGIYAALFAAGFVVI
jgi:hypothetical protein